MINAVGHITLMDANRAGRHMPGSLPVGATMEHAQDILVIDSDQGTQSFMRSLLERRKYGVIWAKSALDAISMIQSSRPEAVVLPTDFVVRGGGWALARHIRDLEPELPILLLRSSGDAEHGTPTDEQDSFNVVSRPVRAAEFIDLIESLTHHVNEN
jgi:DNA-binding NtrC family response regulator